jgi:undecaprenyl-diphosphatase
MWWDVPVLTFANSYAGRSVLFDRLVVLLASYLQYAAVLLFFVFAYTTYSTPLERAASVVFTATVVFIARLIVTPFIRIFHKRLRPYDVLRLNPLFREREWSFPSGHAVFFFALASAVNMFDVWWGLLFFGIALVISVSRIVAGVHYPSDILGGALTGVVVAHATMYLVAAL